jgi:hypothetical protein
VFVLLWLGLVVYLKGHDSGVGGRVGLCDGRCTDVRVCRDGQSPLCLASFGGHASCVEALILGKADVLQCDQ